MSWTSLIPTLLFACTLLAWWFTEPKTHRVNLIAVTGCFLFVWAVAPDFSHDSTVSLYSHIMALAGLVRLDSLVLSHADKLFTAGAVFWLLRRSWQTLWKPVPELISVLGVDVPDPPDVSLAGIRADAATVNWTRAPANKPVQKFLIQVNGVVVGDVAANQDPAIVVSGLKPNHFYNVRVIAVGANNFQAGSRVIRLRTFGGDGRPELGNSRLPSNFHTEEQSLPVQAEHGEENGTPKSPVLALETAAAADSTLSATRDGVTGGSTGTRRNTVTRRHSPSTTSMEHQPIREEVTDESEPTLPELTERFDEIRKEISESTAAIAKEEEESKRLLDDLEGEKQEKRRDQKKKEEQTEKLKRELGTTDRAMRNAVQRRVHKEKQLKDKQNERAKFQDNFQKWEKGIDDMRREQESYGEQRVTLEEERNSKIDSIQTTNQNLQEECGRLEGELKDIREKVKDLEDARKRLPGGEEDAGWREQDMQLRRDWQIRQRSYQHRLEEEHRESRRRDAQIHTLSQHVQVISQSTFDMYNHSNSSGFEFGSSTPNQLKRRSRNSASLSSVMPSPLPAYSAIDPSPQLPLGFSSARAGPPGFAQGPYMELSSLPPRLDEAGIRAQSVPLSPSVATALLPSNILDDDEPPSPTSRLTGPTSLVPPHSGSPENDPQSPASSSRSMSIISSPHGSSHNLPFPQFMGDSSERLSLNPGTLSSPIPPGQPATNRLTNLFSFQRSRGVKAREEGGPTLGSLKHGQSQSFPRQTDDQDAMATKRRISLSTSWNVFNRNSAGPETLEPLAPGSSRLLSARSLNPFSSSHRATGGMMAERDPSSPRPASIASSDLPRPSTDSSSIWGPPGGDGTVLSRPWVEKAPWSRNPSRRPSIHGSSSVLKTTLADAEDEILDEEDLSNPGQVGVIGSRPKSLAQRLNPAATPFMASVFRLKADKDRDKENIKDKDKSKTKDKDKGKDKGKDGKDKSKTGEAAHQGPEGPLRPSIEESPSDSRKSRDALSVHTQTSVSISESRESLTLDQSVSNTTSEPAPGASVTNVKDQENVVRKLFRKGSSSKFSLPGRLGGKDGSGLFKKGPSSVTSVTNSDKNISGEARSSMGDGEDGFGDDGSGGGFSLGRGHDSVTSSPSLGPIPSGGGKSVVGIKEGKTGPTRWFSIKKGKREKESLEIDRDRMSEAETTTPTEESGKA